MCKQTFDEYNQFSRLVTLRYSCPLADLTGRILGVSLRCGRLVELWQSESNGSTIPKRPWDVQDSYIIRLVSYDLISFKYVLFWIY